jgi:hypothetical protein
MGLKNKEFYGTRKYLIIKTTIESLDNILQNLARDLITHLATIHGIAPLSNATISQPNGHSSNKNGESNGTLGIQADLRQLLQLVLEMKSTYGNTMNSVGQFHKVEQVNLTI